MNISSTNNGNISNSNNNTRCPPKLLMISLKESRKTSDDKTKWQMIK